MSRYFIKQQHPRLIACACQEIVKFAVILPGYLHAILSVRHEQTVTQANTNAPARGLIGFHLMMPMHMRLILSENDFISSLSHRSRAKRRAGN